MAQWVSVREAADILGVSQDTVKRKLKAGTLPGHKVNRPGFRRGSDYWEAAAGRAARSS
jgi:excisionase family DNA binding protein